MLATSETSQVMWVICLRMFEYGDWFGLQLGRGTLS